MPGRALFLLVLFVDSLPYDIWEFLCVRPNATVYLLTRKEKKKRHARICFIRCLRKVCTFKSVGHGPFAIASVRFPFVRGVVGWELFKASICQNKQRPFLLARHIDMTQRSTIVKREKAYIIIKVSQACLRGILKLSSKRISNIVRNKGNNSLPRYDTFYRLGS